MPGQNIALMSRNYFALNGVKEVIVQSMVDARIVATVGNEEELNLTLKENQIDHIIFIVDNQDITGVNRFNCISELKKKYPHVLLSLCSSQPNTISLLSGYIDGYLCLDNSLLDVCKQLNRLLKAKSPSTAIRKKESGLSTIEWTILQELKKGIKMQQIADSNDLSYRKVSAIKNIAMRKLGLRNKTELLVFLTR